MVRRDADRGSHKGVLSSGTHAYEVRPLCRARQQRTRAGAQSVLQHVQGGRLRTGRGDRPVCGGAVLFFDVHNDGGVVAFLAQQ